MDTGPRRRARFGHIYEEQLLGPQADATGQIAWENLRAMAVAEDDSDEIRGWRPGIVGAPHRRNGGERIDCSVAANRDKPICRAGADLNALVYQDALDVYKRAGQASGTAGATQHAATMLVAAVNGDRALRSSMPRSPSKPPTVSTPRRSSISASSTRLGRARPKTRKNRKKLSTQSTPMHTSSLRTRQVATSISTARSRTTASWLIRSVSARSTNPAVQSKRADGMVNSAILLERLQRYPEATEYYRRVYKSVQYLATKRNALYRIAEMGVGSSATPGHRGYARIRV